MLGSALSIRNTDPIAKAPVLPEPFFDWAIRFIGSLTIKGIATAWILDGLIKMSSYVIPFMMSSGITKCSLFFQSFCWLINGESSLFLMYLLCMISTSSTLPCFASFVSSTRPLCFGSTMVSLDSSCYWLSGFYDSIYIFSRSMNY